MAVQENNNKRRASCGSDTSQSMKKPLCTPKRASAIKPQRSFRIVITSSTQDKENGDGLHTKSRVATGMEKEEEKERHLQQAIQSQRSTFKGGILFGTIPGTSIPIPKIENIDTTHTKRYHELRRRKQFRRHSNSHPNAMPPEYNIREDCYDMDQEDAVWLAALRLRQIDISIEDFELMMEILENSSRKQVISFPAFCLKMPHVERVKLQLIYDYWLKKRTSLCQTLPAGSLIPLTLSEHENDEKNPYVVFRKRETDHLRRSIRIAFGTPLSNEPFFRDFEKTEREKEIERAEALDKLAYQINQNSEIDGRYCFERNKYCAYKWPGTSFPFGET